MTQIKKSLIVLIFGVILFSGCTVPSMSVPAPTAVPDPEPLLTPPPSQTQAVEPEPVITPTKATIPWQISPDKYVFIRHHISRYGVDLQGKYVGPLVAPIKPEYNFAEPTGTLTFNISPKFEINDALKIIFASLAVYTGASGASYEASIFGIYELPYENMGFKILEIEPDGTAHLESSKMQIILKSGEKWENVESTIDTLQHGDQEKLTSTETIINYGILDKSKIVTPKR